MIIKNIPLSSGNTYGLDTYNQSLESLAVQTDFGSFNQPIIEGIVTVRPLLLGHRSLTDPVVVEPDDFNTEFTQKNLVTFQSLPVYPNKLISATLVLSCSNIPYYSSSFPISVSIGANINPGLITTYFNLVSINRHSVVINTNISVGTNNIDITPLVQYITTLPTWTPNSSIVLYVDGPSTNNQMVRVSAQQSYISLQYSPVVPFAPQNIEVVPGYNEISVSWSPPNDDGGSAILEYSLEYRLVDNNNIATGNWIQGPKTTNTFAAITGLSNDNKYIARVKGRNLVGEGLYSNVSSIISPENRAAPRVSSTYNDANYTRIRLRRDISAAWSGINPILGLGEAGYETDTRFLKVGDNITEWNNLQYVKVPNNSIQFPPYPDVNLSIGDGEFGFSNTRIICNLSDEERLNIVGRNGVTATYSDIDKAVVLSLTQSYNPIYSGTLYSPTTSGQPGNVAYDDQWMYVCVMNNFWKKLPLEQYWFDPTSVSVSNTSGQYPSMTNIAFSGSNMIVTSDGDPYPAKAGQNLVNDGLSPRLGFFGSYDIQDQEYRKIFRYRGPSFSSNPMIVENNPIGIMNNGSVFCGSRIESNTLNIFNVPSGLKFNKIFFSTYFQIDACGGEVILDRSYRYLHGGFLKNCWNNSLFINSSLYYRDSSFGNDHFRHPDGHSKILGFCFDGYPVYGPYTYLHPETPDSGVILSTTSYLARSTDDHRPPNWKFNNAVVINSINYMLTSGAFIDDFDFFEGSGVLDQYNGRFSVTPEYPEGVYAYYLSFTDNTLAVPKYPYIVGPYSRQQRVQ